MKYISFDHCYLYTGSGKLTCEACNNNDRCDTAEITGITVSAPTSEVNMTEKLATESGQYPRHEY